MTLRFAISTDGSKRSTKTGSLARPVAEKHEHRGGRTPGLEDARSERIMAAARQKGDKAELASDLELLSRTGPERLSFTHADRRFKLSTSTPEGQS